MTPEASNLAGWNEKGYKAIVEPFTTRWARLRILKGVGHHAEVVELPDGSKKTIMTPVMELQPFQWSAPPEGEYSPEAAMEAAGFGLDGQNEVWQFIQAIVDLGYELGINPGKAVDRNAEIAAMKEHISDLRTMLRVLQPRS